MPNLDLSLIRVFCAVYETRSVSKAAQSIARSQPAVSYALARLRSTIGNPLFVRHRDGMVPTPLASHLFQEFRRGLEIIDSTVTSVAAFDPFQSGRQFRIAMTDIGEMVFLPPLIGRLRKNAPRITVQSCQVSPTETPRALATGQLDFAIGYLPGLQVRIAGVDTFSEQYVCLFRKGHGTIGKTMSLEDFESCEHVVVSSMFNSHHEMSDSLLAMGVRRKITLQLSHFTSLPDILAQTDFVAAVPSRVAKLFASTHPLRILPIPAELSSFNVRLHWDSALDLDRGHCWMRNLIIDTLSCL